jgi:hypothetical protein
VAAVGSLVVAAAAPVAAAVAAAVAGDPGRGPQMNTDKRRSAKEPTVSAHSNATWRDALVAIVTAGLLAMSPAQAADTKAAPEAKKAAAPKQKVYGTPEEAVKDLVGAVKARDSKLLLSILGPEGKPIASSGDKVADREGGERFVKAYEEANKLEKLGDDRIVVSVGKDSWPFPIPVVKEAAGWRFDTKTGLDEILNRRIGRNELSVMQVALAYVDAQREYYLRNPQKDKLLSYAQKFISTKGKRDGLYFETKDGEPQSPLGPAFEAAKAKGASKDEGGKPIAYHGYHYRILKAQGSDAPGGAYDYVAQGKMIGGHALIAWPATYGNSGVMTFLVNHDGVVYEKDLGPQTSAAAQKITKFNPDKTWKKSEPASSPKAAPVKAAATKPAEPAKAAATKAEPAKAQDKK